MCGFVGFFGEESPEEKEVVAREMANAIVHRGPDSDGYFADERIALGFRRLSIVDLSGGDQPIYNETNDLVIVFNGEVYNFRELRAELEEKGHVFRTRTDTEAVLHGYEEYGDALFEKLRGMFAFVIYDKKTGELVGCRDPFGIKPFYYYRTDSDFFFSSEIKGMLPHPRFCKEINDRSLKMYLIFQYSVFEETFFKNVYKLKPGHFFRYKNGDFFIKPYFTVDFQKVKKPYKTYRKEIARVLADSVRTHQITADVEVGSYLSGGVDSSFVVAEAKPDKTFSVGFDLPGFDETKYARDLSDLMQVKNFSKEITKEEFFDALPRVQYYTDEPHANLSSVPLLFLSELASRQVKVVLSGEGADEMFGGYNEYLEPLPVRFYTALPRFIKAPIAALAKRFPHFPGQNTLIKYAKPFCERYLGHAQIMDENEANAILSDRLKDEMTTSDVLAPYFEKVLHENDIVRKMYIDMHFWLPQDILLKADKMSMANSLELRVPFLDKEVFALAKGIPTRFLVRRRKTKEIFRSVAADSLPKEWSDRRKCGFPVPFSKWIREETYYRRLREAFEKPFVKEFFDQKEILRLLSDHYTGKANHGRKLYNIYIFLVWYQVYFESETVSVPQ